MVFYIGLKKCRTLFKNLPYFFLFSSSFFSILSFSFCIPKNFSMCLLKFFFLSVILCLHFIDAMQVKIHKLLLQSRFRTKRKDEADFFFVPTYIKCVRMMGGLNDKEINQTYVKVMHHLSNLYCTLVIRYFD